MLHLNRYLEPFLEVARHRLPGATFDSLLREALEACAVDESTEENQSY